MEGSVLQRDEFKNVSGGWIGVVTLEPGGRQRPISVPPNGTVWLSEEEQVLTANAPVKDEDNPLINGQLVLQTEAGNVKNRRPLRPDTPVQAEAADPAGPQPPAAPPQEETGAPPQPAGEPEEGQRQANEEIGTPEAPAKAGVQQRAAQPAQQPQPEMADTVPPRPKVQDPVRPAQEQKVPEPVAKRG